MKIFNLKQNSPYETLALENIIMNDESIQGDVLLIYQHTNAIVVGNNQNTHEEINRQYVIDNNIDLARRLSGGGAVYHDLGNVNFSFITDYNKKGGYERFLEPIIKFLRSLGLDAQFKGRNDLLVNGAKVSGNAQYLNKNRIVSHGTLLFDVDLTKLGNALNPSRIKYESKGIQSVRARVTNILDELKTKITVKEFIEKLINFFVKNNNAELVEVPIKKYQGKLNELKTKFSSEEWIFNKAANFNFSNGEKFAGGILKIKGNVEKGIIQKLVFEGDFLSKKDVKEIEPLFSNIKLREEDILNILNKINFEDYFGTIQKDEIIKLLLG
ncbi:lipoate--protein ligase [Mycoplasma sp. Mirounga ES2805-ORL]|uniref:lipoate--protein ligase n=1 Tax=Mycoplasma sp. Mirounga ES2805-ORL TaxID=754514 RepID=UPI00197C4305|nr:lipoate--protein ligase [Mycoplasma sp. Mirounga ES2805-ORL]QSF13514.1 lipoate--protein ligase [Mycoplasma sp. Mirounga ES2805-ORL]